MFYLCFNVWMDLFLFFIVVGFWIFDFLYLLNVNCFIFGWNCCFFFSFWCVIELLFFLFMNGVFLEIWVFWSCCWEFGIWRCFEIVFLWCLIFGYVSGICILCGLRSFFFFFMDNWMVIYWFLYFVKNW